MNMEGSFALIAGGMILLFVIAVIIMWYFAKKHAKKHEEERLRVYKEVTAHFQAVLDNPKSTDEQKMEAAKQQMQAKLALEGQRSSLKAAHAMNDGYYGPQFGYGFGGRPFGYGGGWGGGGVGIDIHADI